MPLLLPLHFQRYMQKNAVLFEQLGVMCSKCRGYVEKDMVSLPQFKRPYTASSRFLMHWKRLASKKNLLALLRTHQIFLTSDESKQLSVIKRLEHIKLNKDKNVFLYILRHDDL